MPFRRPVPLLLASLACAIGVLVGWIVGHTSGPGYRIDDGILQRLVDHRTSERARFAHDVASLADPGSFFVLAAVVVAIAVLRRRLDLAVAAGAILALSNVTTQVLKPLLASDRVAEAIDRTQISAASYPSGHTTAAVSLSVAALLVAPVLVRPLVALLGLVFSLAVGFSLVFQGWHYPSDIVGAWLVVGAWTTLVLAVLAARATARTGATGCARAPRGAPTPDWLRARG